MCFTYRKHANIYYDNDDTRNTKDITSRLIAYHTEYVKASYKPYLIPNRYSEANPYYSWNAIYIEGIGIGQAPQKSYSILYGTAFTSMYSGTF